VELAEIGALPGEYTTSAGNFWIMEKIIYDLFGNQVDIYSITPGNMKTKWNFSMAARLVSSSRSYVLLPELQQIGVERYLVKISGKKYSDAEVNKPGVCWTVFNELHPIGGIANALKQWKWRSK